MVHEEKTLILSTKNVIMGPANHVVYIIVVHYSSLCCASSRTESDFNDGSGS